MTTLVIERARDGLWIGMRRRWRAVRVLVHSLYGLWLALIWRAFWQPLAPSVRCRAQRWQQQLLRMLALEVERVGAPDPSAGLVVSNHVSWLDIPVIGAHQDVHFLSKAEVRDWLLIGALATAAGTLFIRRGAGESRQKAVEVAGHLSAGRRVMVFPEGTTSDGGQLKRFFSPLFHAAVLADTPVQPLVIRYLDAHGDTDIDPAFIGDDNFHSHLWRLLRRDHIRVRVLYLPSIQADNAEQLCQQCHLAIARRLTG